jgi:hypothetical protein
MIDVSFVIPVKNDYRVIESINKIKEYIHSRVITAEVIICGRLGYNPIPEDVRFIKVEPPDKGRCIRTGALASKGNIVILIDSDLPVLLTDIDKVISSAISTDVVFGNRYLPYSSRSTNEPLIRRILSVIFRLLIQLIFQLKGFDTQCGVKAIRKSVKEKLFKHQIVYGFAYDVELAIRTRQLGLNFVQIPVHLKNSLYSTINTRQAIVSISRELIHLFFYFKLKTIQDI